MLGKARFDLAWAVFMRNATDYSHTWKMNILPNFFEPLLFLVAMGVGLGSYLEGGIGGSDYVVFIAPGLCAASAMNGASFEVTYNMFVRMVFGRLYDAYLATPAQVEDIVLGELLWAVARGLIYGLTFLLVMAVMTLLGWPVLASATALLLPLALALVGAMFALIGQLFTACIKVIDLYAYYYTLFLTPLFLFSGIFFPVDRFPLGESFAWCTPLHHAVHVCRGLAQGPLAASHAVSVLWMLALCALLSAIVPRRLRARLFQ